MKSQGTVRAVSSARSCWSPWGIAQGFDTYFEDVRPIEVRAGGRHRRSPAAGERGRGPRRAWLRRPSDLPFFAWSTCTTSTRRTRPRTVRIALSAKCRALRRRWNSRTRQLGRLLDALARRATTRSSWSRAITANALGEQQEPAATGSSSYDAVTRCSDHHRAGGSRLSLRPIRSASSTSCRPCSRPPHRVPGAVQGKSLLAAARGQRLDLSPCRRAGIRATYGWSELTAVRDGRYKFIAAPGASCTTS